MKSRFLALITGIAVTASLAIPMRIHGQQENGIQHHHYKLIDMGTFGGPHSYVFDSIGANILNNQGTFTGWADTSPARSLTRRLLGYGLSCGTRVPNGA